MFYFEGFSSFHQSWLYTNLHCIIVQTFPSLVLIVFYLHRIIVYSAFSSLVLIVYYLGAFPSLYQSWLYANLQCIIAHTTFPSFILIVFYLPSNYFPFTNYDYIPTYCTAYCPWLLVVPWSGSFISVVVMGVNNINVIFLYVFWIILPIIRVAAHWGASWGEFGQVYYNIFPSYILMDRFNWDTEGWHTASRLVKGR